MIELIFDFLFPTTNHAYGVAAKGKHAFMYKTAEAKNKAALVQAALYSIDITNLQPPLGLYIAVYLNKNMRDIGSSTKLIQDAICDSLKINDNNIYLVIEEKIVEKTCQPQTKIVFGTLTEVYQWFHIHRANHLLGTDKANQPL